MPQDDLTFAYVLDDADNLVGVTRQEGSDPAVLVETFTDYGHSKGEVVMKIKILSFLSALLLGGLLTIGLGGFCAKESDYQYYSAKGLTLEEAVSRFGPPLQTRSFNDDDLYLYYFTDALETVELKVKKGLVIDVELYVED